MVGPMSATAARVTARWPSAVRTRLIDLALWLFVCVPMAVSPFIEERMGLGEHLPGVVLALVLILARHRWPIPSLGIGLVGAVVLTAVTERPSALLPVSVALLFHVAVTHDRATSIGAGIAGLVTVLACVAILVSSDLFGPELLAGIAWPTLAVAAGDAVRSGREAITAAEGRAERAEATRHAEARRRVAEERLHIARELHDVVAHQTAVINVQAGVAAHLLEERPDDARAALLVVRSSARQVLDDLSDVLGVLRQPGEEASPSTPTPSLDDLPALLASFEPVGLRITYLTDGEPQPVPETTALAVYRTVQEALTNAHKHGDGNVTLRITHRPDVLEVATSNRLGPSVDPTTAPGYGLVGMRERVGAANGEVAFGPGSQGSFEILARFPVLRPAVDR